MGKSPIFVTKTSMPPYEEYIERIKPLWDSRILTNMGKYHQELEEELKKYLSVDHLSLMTNGHMSLEMTLQAMGLSGEVITTPFTFVSTVHAISRNNLTPVFCDIEEESLTIDVKQIEKLINKRTSAIVPVHVFGRRCNVEEIQRLADDYGLKVIYDAAHCFGVTYKGNSLVKYGDASILSFHATKAFSTIEGGAVVYGDEALGKELYSLKNFGIRSEVLIDGIGANAKMDEFRAIMGLCNLKYIDSEIEKRKKVYECYVEELKEAPGIKIPEIQDEMKMNYAYFPILAKERDLIYDVLRENNIFARKYFYPLINDTMCYKSIYSSKETPVALRVSREVLTLPIYSDLTLDAVREISKIILQQVEKKG